MPTFITLAITPSQIMDRFAVILLSNSRNVGGTRFGPNISTHLSFFPTSNIVHVSHISFRNWRG